MIMGMRARRMPAILLITLLMTMCAVIGWSQPASAKRNSDTTSERQPSERRSIADEIREESGGKIKKFYESRGFKPLWANSGTIGPEANTLIRYLESAAVDGLNPSSYDLDDLREAMSEARSGDTRAVARAEVKLSRAFAHYVIDLRRRRATGMTYLDDRLKPKKQREDTVLRVAALTPSFREYVANMGWMSTHYVRLRAALARADQAGGSDDALRRIRLNLERARALPGPWTHHIVVDAASGRLWFYQAGKQAGSMRVVTGTAETPTPMMAGMVQYAIINPYWNVPVDLAQRKIAPKVLKGRSLKSMGMEALSDWSPSPSKLDPAAINWRAVASGTQEVRLRQLPGVTNSMGKVKFLFPNGEGIFLHDTPDRALFAKTERHFSNGCIRLEDAAGLGKWLMGKPLRAASKAPEQPVALPVPVPIYLTYFTANTTGNGDVAFIDDVYGRDG